MKRKQPLRPVPTMRDAMYFTFTVLMFAATAAAVFYGIANS
jgi:preprotein translocase subunit SecE